MTSGIGSHVGSAVDVDVGLRSHMLRVYNHMAAGVALTGVMSWLLSLMVVTDGKLNELGVTLFTGPMFWVLLLSPLAVLLVMSFGAASFGKSTLFGLFYVYAGLVGLSLTPALLVYTGESVVKIFFVTSAAFGALSLYGYTTKRDLNALGVFCLMGLFGIIIAAIVNLFTQSTMLAFVLTCASVLVFAGLTAYDTQKIKEMYSAADGNDVAGRKAIMGALSLYLDFLNLFLSLLRLFGEKR